MKKFLVAVVMLGGIFTMANAQRILLSDVEIALRDQNYDVAKEKIDLAYEQINDKYRTKIFYKRGEVYYWIAVDTNYTSLDPNASYVSLESYIKCIESERGQRKQKFTPRTLQTDRQGVPDLPAAALTVYIKSLTYYNKGDYDNTLKYWDLLIKGYETDTIGQVPKRLNTSKNDIIQNCAIVAINKKDNKKAREYLNRLIKDPKYLSATGYVQLSLLDLEKGDTAKALEVIDQGRKKIPDDKTLFNQELNLYTQMGKIDILIKKLDEVIKNEPNNTLYLFFRGAIINDEAVKIMEAANQYTDSASDARAKIKRTSSPAKKKALQANIDKFLGLRDSGFANARAMFSKAEKDYNEALLIDPYYFDALFNMGVMYFNMNKELIYKYNYLDVFNAKDKKRAEVLEPKMKAMIEKALEYLLKAEEVKPNDPELLYALQQSYSQLGDNEKSKEYKERRDALNK